MLRLNRNVQALTQFLLRDFLNSEIYRNLIELVETIEPRAFRRHRKSTTNLSYSKFVKPHKLKPKLTLIGIGTHSATSNHTKLATYFLVLRRIYKPTKISRLITSRDFLRMRIQECSVKFIGRCGGVEWYQKDFEFKSKFRFVMQFHNHLVYKGFQKNLWKRDAIIAKAGKSIKLAPQAKKKYFQNISFFPEKSLPLIYQLSVMIAGFPDDDSLHSL